MVNIRLRTTDSQIFTMDVRVACMSQTIKDMLSTIGSKEPKEGEEPEVVDIANVNGPTMKLVHAFLEKYKDEPEPPAAEDDEDADKRYLTHIPDWDKKFLDGLPQSQLFELICAANYLDIKQLLDLTCQWVANMIKGKKPQEIRELFNIENDFTKEEEERIKKENEWCEEK